MEKIKRMRGSNIQVLEQNNFKTNLDIGLGYTITKPKAQLQTLLTILQPFYSLSLSLFRSLSLSLSLLSLSNAHTLISLFSLRLASPSDPTLTFTMFRRATSTFLSRAAATRRFSTDVATPAADSAFHEAWRKVSPNLDPPKTPLEFLKARPPVPSTLPTKLTVNFVLPYSSQLAAKEVSLFSSRFVHIYCFCC
jgi:hypothetical protein